MIKLGQIYTKLRLVAKSDHSVWSPSVNNCKVIIPILFTLHMLKIEEGFVTTDMRFVGSVQIGCKYFAENNA